MNIGDFRHAMTVQTATRTKVSGGKGYTESWEDEMENPWWCSIEPASAARMERLAAGGAALMSTATHILFGRHYEGLTTGQRLLEGSRMFSILGVQNVREDDMFTRVFAEEVEGQSWVQRDWIQSNWVQP